MVHALARGRLGALVGGLGIEVGDEPLSEEEQEAAARFTEAATVALSNLRTFTEEHRIALALQRALLPSGLRVSGGVEVVARYEASDARLDVGGDFYDAFDLPDGRVAVVIGDVQGHLRAATVMAEVRVTLRAYLREGHDAASALDLLNAALREDHPEFATVCVCVLDPARAPSSSRTPATCPRSSCAPTARSTGPRRARACSACRARRPAPPTTTCSPPATSSCS